MIPKYFGRGEESNGGLDYFLDEKRVAEGTAFVARGNVEATKFLIKSNKNKLKYRSGCLAFEENEMAGKTKEEIMDLFEKSTFAGLKKWQYNILWVQHHDKANGRIELNFIIPRQELSSGKSFNPHWHKEDQTRLLLLRDVINNKYKFTLPNKKEKSQELILDKRWKKGNSKKEKAHALVTEGINNGEIGSRDDVIKYLKSEGYNITRTKAEKSISIEKDGTKMRMEGTFYHKAFTSFEALDAELQEIEDKHTYATAAELSQLEAELEKLIDHKAKVVEQRYPRPEPTAQDKEEVYKFEAEDKLDEQDIRRVVERSTAERAERNRRIREREERAREREADVLKRIREHRAELSRVDSERSRATSIGTDQLAVAESCGGLDELVLSTQSQLGQLDRESEELIEHIELKAEEEQFNGQIEAVASSIRGRFESFRDSLEKWARTHIEENRRKLERTVAEFGEKIERVGEQVERWLEDSPVRKAHARIKEMKEENALTKPQLKSGKPRPG